MAGAEFSPLIQSRADLIAYLSSLYTLEPGDLIYTGTPSGVGPVKVGDRLVVTIDGLTSLEVTVGPQRS